jgi:hypothetical protein
MKIQSVATNDVVVEVTPTRSRNFGFIRTNGEEQSPEAEYNKAVDLERQIKRHVDGYEAVDIVQKRIFKDEHGDTHNTLFELLYNNLSDSTIEYTYRYERPSDNGIGTRGTTYKFDELVEIAFKNPNKFQIISGELTDTQINFLSKVVQHGRLSRIEWV